MREAHELERAVGMEYYASDADGTGGRLRDAPGDFRVTEIEEFDVQPADGDTGDYPWLVVRATLTGWDTNDFARSFANAVGMSRERVTWAGTKDRHAVTTQLFAIRDLDAADVPEVRNADVKVVGRAGRGLQFGDLAGNEFRVVVRDPENPGKADGVTEDLRDFGSGAVATPNYFGQQRFGSKRPITHEVGLAILRDDWEGAAMAYLGRPTDYEPADSQRAREYVEDTRDWAGALDEFPGDCATSARCSTNSQTAGASGTPSRRSCRTSSACSSTPRSRTRSTGCSPSAWPAASRSTSRWPAT